MQINIYAAKTQLSRLVDRVNAGEEVVITRHGRSAAEQNPARKLGTLRGKIWMSDDFAALLPNDLQALFEGRVISWK
jgi:antitoxin (DNA-binding transcriptional repressor) of toxin-antitoxin stability system